MISILDRHLARALLSAAAVTAVVLLGLSGFVSLVEELDWASRHDLGISVAALLTAYKLPELLFEMFPLVVLLGAILGLGGLASSGELVVMQGAGMPLWRLALSVAVVGLLLGVLSLIVGDRLVPAARAATDTLKDAVTSVATDGRGLWLRDGARFVHVEDVVEPTRLHDVRIFSVGEGGNALTAVDSCEDVEYRDGRWFARGWSREQPGESRLLVSADPARALDLGFGPDVIELFLLRSDSLSLPGLRRYIAYLEQNKLDSHGPRLSFWKKVSAPLSVVAMVLLAVPFVLGPLRDTGAGQRLFLGVLMGIGFYVFSETVVSMGAVYRWPPLLAALAPGVLLSIVASWRLLTYKAR